MVEGAVCSSRASYEVTFMQIAMHEGKLRIEKTPRELQKRLGRVGLDPNVETGSWKFASNE
jgi:hypothetical protein